MVVLFLLSLLLVAGGMWITVVLRYVEIGPGAVVVVTIVSIASVILNVVVVPYLAASLLSRIIDGRLKKFLDIWNGALLLECLLYPFVGDPGPILSRGYQRSTRRDDRRGSDCALEGAPRDSAGGCSARRRSLFMGECRSPHR